MGAVPSHVRVFVTMNDRATEEDARDYAEEKLDSPEEVEEFMKLWVPANERARRTRCDNFAADVNRIWSESRGY